MPLYNLEASLKMIHIRKKGFIIMASTRPPLGYLNTTADPSNFNYIKNQEVKFYKKPEQEESLSDKLDKLDHQTIQYNEDGYRKF